MCCRHNENYLDQRRAGRFSTLTLGPSDSMYSALKRSSFRVWFMRRELRRNGCCCCSTRPCLTFPRRPGPGLWQFASQFTRITGKMPWLFGGGGGCCAFGVSFALSPDWDGRPVAVCDAAGGLPVPIDLRDIRFTRPSKSFSQLISIACIDVEFSISLDGCGFLRIDFNWPFGCRNAAVKPCISSRIFFKRSYSASISTFLLLLPIFRDECFILLVLLVCSCLYFSRQFLLSFFLEFLS